MEDVREERRHPRRISLVKWNNYEVFHWRHFELRCYSFLLVVTSWIGLPWAMLLNEVSSYDKVHGCSQQCLARRRKQNAHSISKSSRRSKGWSVWFSCWLRFPLFFHFLTIPVKVNLWTNLNLTGLVNEVWTESQLTKSLWTCQQSKARNMNRTSRYMTP